MNLIHYCNRMSRYGQYRKWDTIGLQDHFESKQYDSFYTSADSATSNSSDVIGASIISNRIPVTFDPNGVFSTSINFQMELAIKDKRIEELENELRLMKEILGIEDL